MAINEISGSNNPPLPKMSPTEIGKAGSSFSEMMLSTIRQVEESQNVGEKAMQDISTGQAKNLHDVMIATEEADISMRMLVQVRNKAMQVYDEVMKMQV